MGMRMSPEEYFRYRDDAPPSLFYDLPCGPSFPPGPAKPLCHTVIGPGGGHRYAPTVAPADHTALIAGIAAIAAVVGMVVLGLAFLSRK